MNNCYNGPIIILILAISHSFQCYSPWFFLPISQRQASWWPSFGPSLIIIPTIINHEDGHAQPSSTVVITPRQPTACAATPWAPDTPKVLGGGAHGSNVEDVGQVSTWEVSLVCHPSVVNPVGLCLLGSILIANQLAFGALYYSRVGINLICVAVSIPNIFINQTAQNHWGKF